MRRRLQRRGPSISTAPGATPALDYFSSDAPIAADRIIPLEYLGAAFVYSAIYITIAMLAALLLFEDRDLA